MAETHVSYFGSRLIPAPAITINKEYQRSGDGQILGTLYSIVVEGDIFSYKGSPTSSGTFHTIGGYPNDEVLTDDEKLGSFIRKIDAINDLFSTHGQLFEVQGADGTLPLKFYPRITGITIPVERGQVTRIPYTINMEADILYVGGQIVGDDAFDDYISEAEESWTIETDESNPEGVNVPVTYRLSHSVSATGKRIFTADGLSMQAWEQARSWVQARLGFDSVIALSSGVNNLPSYYGGYNHIRSENIGKMTGSYGVTETWLLSSGTALEQFNIQHSIDGGDGNNRVSIDGTITGLTQRNSSMQITTDAYTNANSKFDSISGVLLTRARNYSGISTLNSSPLSTTIGRNPVGGTINYSYQYDDRPTNLITGSKSEVISIVDNVNQDIIAQIGVLGRTTGPVLQNVNAKRASTRSLNIEIVFGGSFAGASSTAHQRLNTYHPLNISPQREEIAAIINAADPVLAGIVNNDGNVATTGNITDRNINWTPNNGRFSESIQWVYE